MKKIAAGIMSGTSLDGIDIVLAAIDEKTNTTPVVIASETIPYQEETYKLLKTLLIEQVTHLETITKLNKILAKEFAEALKLVCLKAAVQTESLEFVACHGQTVYHISQTQNKRDAASLQLGDGSMMAQYLKTTVITNFRNADIAVMGEGAPLVPYADYTMFKSHDKSRALQNIGGIGNVTILPKNALLDDLYAFDTGPGNMMIDYAMQTLFKQPFDPSGRYALKGALIDGLLAELLDNSYFKAPIPKSTGREMFGDQYTAKILKQYKDEDPYDIIHTLTFFTAKTITDAYTLATTKKIDEIIVSGGGSHNKTLLNMIQTLAPKSKVLTLEALGYDSDYKEALVFLLLGYETLNRRPSNVKSATGANKQVILGQVAYYN